MLIRSIPSLFVVQPSKETEMSEITLFKSGAALPDYLRSDEDDFTRRLAGTPQGKSISIDGGVWRMIVGGEEIAKNEDRAMNFVVVNAAPSVSRTYYSGSYVKGQATAPDCWSADSKAPDASVKSPQSSACATCPQNIEGSGEGKSRACRFFLNTAVVLEGDMQGNVYRLKLPSKSYFGKPEGEKMPFQAYAKFLSGHGIPMGGVVTEARFDTSESVPVLKFRAVRPLTKPEWEMSRQQGKTEDAQRAIETKFSTTNVTASGPALPESFTPEATAAVVEAPAPAPAKRESKKAEPAAAPKDVKDVLAQWSSDDEE
jgi:hypothetical protein